MSVLAALLALAGAATGTEPAAQPAATSAPATHVSARNVPLETGLARTTLAEGLENPWAVAFLPDGTILVTERPGRLRMISGGQLRPEPIAGVPAVFARGQGGLLDMVLHPDFANNRLIYFTYAAGTMEGNQTRVAVARFDGTALTEWRDIFVVPQLKQGGQHFGARLAFAADGHLLVSIGDGGNPPNRLDGRLIRENAQDPASALGKVLRMTDTGAAPGDNPMAGQPGMAAYIWSMGHRNIQGLAIDSATGAVWASEHGALGGDELNQIQRGGNFGWPLASGTREYVGGADVGQPETALGMLPPVLRWEVATAPSGLVVYRGSAFAAWQGDVLSGGLRSVDIRRVDLDAEGRVVGETAIGVGARVRDVRQGPDGAIYVLTDERSGRLIRIAPETPAPAAPAAAPAPR